eukprot:TRINITY_DN3179_c0_g1_i1.p1 TRINITY_DN3179_c0_g1~~TRINITY_DN3179_c0_g1_i1.p1  ORF type:complete len:359 (-),score=71.42 TRINITY_DN3179_c0_g1_i1:61-1137(-)
MQSPTPLLSPPPPTSSTETSPRPAKKWPTVIAEGEGTEDLLEPVNESDPSADVTQPINWDEASSYARSAEGAAGVFFVTVNGGVVVVKGTMTVVQETFSTRLAQLLNIRVPQIRVVNHYDDEMASLRRNIARLAEIIGPADLIKVERELDRPFVLLMEFTGGKDLETLPRSSAAWLLGMKADQKENLRLRALGNLAALDMLTNNWDRIPFVWDNSGNWKNVILHKSEKGWELVGIDHGFTAIVIPEGMEKYTARVNTYVSKLVKQPSKEASETKSVREILRGHTTYDIGEAGSVEIQRGIMDVVSTVTSMQKEEFEKLRAEVAAMAKEDSNSVWEQGMNTIDTNFLWSIVQVFSNCLA